MSQKPLSLQGPWFSLTPKESLDFPGGVSRKEPVYQCRRLKRHGFDPWVGKIPWRRSWQPTPVFLPAESYGQRSLVDYSPWGHKESDMTEVTQHTRRQRELISSSPRIPPVFTPDFPVRVRSAPGPWGFGNLERGRQGPPGWGLTNSAASFRLCNNLAT